MIRSGITMAGENLKEWESPLNCGGLRHNQEKACTHRKYDLAHVTSDLHNIHTGDQENKRVAFALRCIREVCDSE